MNSLFSPLHKLGLALVVMVAGAGALPACAASTGEETATGVDALSGANSLRVPVLDESGALVNKTDRSFPKTMILDGRTGPDQFTELTGRLEAKGIEPMRFGSPNDYETSDPSTSICFKGDENAVCDLLSAFTDNLLGDMFGIAGGEDGDSGCVVKRDSVSITFFMSESDSTSSAKIPRCK